MSWLDWDMQHDSGLFSSTRKAGENDETKKRKKGFPLKTVAKTNTKLMEPKHRNEKSVYHMKTEENS